MLINFVRLTLLYALPYVIAVLLGIHLPLSKLLDVIALSSFVTMANSFIPIPGASGGTEMMFSIVFFSIVSLSNKRRLDFVESFHVSYYIGARRIIFMVAKAYYERRKDAPHPESEA